MVRVEVTGLCRSDWHAFAGHDDDVVLPHVGGHEWAGHGDRGRRRGGRGPGRASGSPRRSSWPAGPARRAAPASSRCATTSSSPASPAGGPSPSSSPCPRAAVNLVRLPDEVDAGSAALLGCRFATAFRALLPVGRLAAGERLAVHGCGGVGLSAVQVAVAAGARVVAVDVDAAARRRALDLGAEAAVDPAGDGWAEVGARVREASDGGTHVSLDAIGSEDAVAASLAGLRRRGRHVQVGLLPPALGLPRVPAAPRRGRRAGAAGQPRHGRPRLPRAARPRRGRPPRPRRRSPCGPSGWRRRGPPSRRWADRRPRASRWSGPDAGGAPGREADVRRTATGRR